MLNCVLRHNLNEFSLNQFTVITWIEKCFVEYTHTAYSVCSLLFTSSFPWSIFSLPDASLFLLSQSLAWTELSFYILSRFHKFLSRKELVVSFNKHVAEFYIKFQDNSNSQNPYKAKKCEQTMESHLILCICQLVGASMPAFEGRMPLQSLHYLHPIQSWKKAILYSITAANVILFKSN